MALDLRSTYGIQVLSGQPGYPYGKPRNVTVPGDGTGFPLEATWVCDVYGFLQALLDEGSGAPSGVPDQVGASDYVDAIKFLTRNITGNVDVFGGITCHDNGFSGTFFQTGGTTIGQLSVTFGLFVPVTVFGPATFWSPTTFEQEIQITPGGIVVGPGGVAIGNGLDGIIVQVGGVTILAGGFSVAAGTVDITPPTTFHDEIVLADAARIRKRIRYGTDVNSSTYSFSTADRVVIKTGTLSAARDYKIDNTAAALGAEVEFWNFDSQVITVKNIGGSTLGTVPILSGVTPGKLRIAYVDDHTGERWLAVGAP